MSAPVTVIPDALPGLVKLPPVDSSLPDLLVYSTAPQIWLALSTGPDGAGVPVGPLVVGNYIIPASGTIIFRRLASSVTQATLVAQCRSGTISFQRVPASFITVFPCVDY